MVMELILITGMSGSGKSVALHALEDAGFYCVDNLPPELLLDFVALEKKHHASRVAIAMDVRSASSLPLVPKQLEQLRKDGVSIKCVDQIAFSGCFYRHLGSALFGNPAQTSSIPKGRWAGVYG